MKKTILVLGLLASLVMLVGCASTKGDSSQVFKIRESFDGTTYFYYLTKAPSAYKACVNHDIFYKTSDTTVGNMYYSQSKEEIEKMLNEGHCDIYYNSWLGYTPLLLDYYPNNDEASGWATQNSDNPLVDTDLPSIYVIKPYANDNTKALVKNGPTYTIQVIDKSSKAVVKTFDNVVLDWQGMIGWNGQVVAEDYTFITKDVKQYVVKGNKYTIKVIK